MKFGLRSAMSLIFAAVVSGGCVGSFTYLSVDRGALQKSPAEQRRELVVHAVEKAVLPLGMVSRDKIEKVREIRDYGGENPYYLIAQFRDKQVGNLDVRVLEQRSNGHTFIVVRDVGWFNPSEITRRRIEAIGTELRRVFGDSAIRVEQHRRFGIPS